MRRSAADRLEAEDMSPSHREKLIEEEVANYQKPEIIRRAVKRVRDEAAEQRAKRERLTHEIKKPSKVKKNLAS